jgi:hypothetical protein
VFRVVFSHLRRSITLMIEFTKYILAVISGSRLERGLALLANLKEVPFVHPLRLLLGHVSLLSLVLIALLLLYLPFIPYLREITLNLLDSL